MNFIDYIKHIVKLRGYDFAYGDMYEINRKLNDIDFEKSKDGIVSFAYIITESEGGDRQSATAGIYFCKLCPFDLDANDTLEWQRTLRNAANTMFSDIAAGNISRTSNHRFNYGYNDFAENVLWVCARFDIEALACGCNEFVFRDEIVRRIEFVEVLENGDYRYKIVFNDGSFQFFESPRGPQGDDGPPGTTDYNELQNKPTKLSDFENDSDFITYDDAAETYVVKESGKGLSSNDYTNAEKNKLAGIEAGAQKNPTAVSQLENDAQYLKLQEVKPNGNIVLTDGTNSREYMAATPSGDQMHYAYVAAGAEYNATGADFTKTAPWGDQVTHKAGYWYLNGLGDLTNEEMRTIFVTPTIKQSTNANVFASSLARTVFSGSVFTNDYFKISGIKSFNNEGRNSSIEVFYIDSYNKGTQYAFMISNGQAMFNNSHKLFYIGVLDARNNTTFSEAFSGCEKLVYCYIIKIKANISFYQSNLLSNSSILYMIENADTVNFTITLHADAYARAMADPDIQAALAAKPNVSLASA